eukprot:scaffold34009_cov90-Isochrysis_galbana.AAC.1
MAGGCGLCGLAEGLHPATRAPMGREEETHKPSAPPETGPASRPSSLPGCQRRTCARVRVEAPTRRRCHHPRTQTIPSPGSLPSARAPSSRRWRAS